MPTKTDVCNIALVVHLGADPITSFGETDTKNGRLCNRVYEYILRDMLEDHPWQFAKKSAALNVLSDEDPVEWAYAYKWPSDCVMPREIQRPSRSAVPTNFEIMENSDGDRIICTNQQDAVLIYTAYLDNPNMYTAKFRKAFSFALAVAMSPTTAPKQKIEKLEDMADKALSMAKSADTQTKSEDTEPDCEFITARI